MAIHMIIDKRFYINDYITKRSSVSVHLIHGARCFNDGAVEEGRVEKNLGCNLWRIHCWVWWPVVHLHSVVSMAPHLPPNAILLPTLNWGAVNHEDLTTILTALCWQPSTLQSYGQAGRAALNQIVRSNQSCMHDYGNSYWGWWIISCPVIGSSPAGVAGNFFNDLIYWLINLTFFYVMHVSCMPNLSVNSVSLGSSSSSGQSRWGKSDASC